MENGRTKTLLKNSRATDAPAAKPEGDDKRLGMVERRLNHRDRLLIFRAISGFFKKKQGATNVEAERLRKLNEILDPESVESYFESIDLSSNTELIAWRQALEAQLTKKVGQPEPPLPGKRPRTSKAELRGKDSTFFLPPKVDSLIKDAIQGAQWDLIDVEYATELCKKYEINVEE